MMNTPRTPTSARHPAWLIPCLLAGLAACGDDNPPQREDDVARTAIECEVGIIGGGAGGLHTAFRLGPTRKDGVCLFEKEAALGGRILDIAREPGGPVYGAGALRIMEGQRVVFGLADELGIKYEAAANREDLVSARGEFTYSADDMNVAAYPLVDDKLKETDLYDQLRKGPMRASAAGYPDFRSYVRAVVKEQGYHFLTDVFRFRADFEYALDARGYLDYLDEEWDVCCTPSYPEGGMSEFIRRMEARAATDGVRIFKSEPALSLDREDGRYVVRTPRYLARVGRLVIGVDAVALRRVNGAVAEAIKAQPQFQDLVGVRVATVTQWWPSAWWKNARPGHDINRAWTTEHCLNHIEIPLANYAASQNVTRSVYDDDVRCVEFWENTAARSTTAVEDEILRGLRYLFPGVNIPRPQKTHVQIWPGAWYWLRGGSRFTNADIARWAVEPLAGEPVHLVGESYNPQRSGWSDGAYKSSIRTLNAKFGLNLPGGEGMSARLLGAGRASRSDGGR